MNLLARTARFDTMRVFFLFMSIDKVTGRSEFSGGISDREISRVLMESEYLGIIAPAFDQQIIREFRRRLQADMDDNGVNARTAMDERGGDIATDLAAKEYAKLRPAERRLIAEWDILEKKSANHHPNSPSTNHKAPKPMPK